MQVARHEFAQLIERAFDGAIMVDGQRVIAHKSGIHVVRGTSAPARTPTDRDASEPAPSGCNDWSDV
jgi:hypothetical protein